MTYDDTYTDHEFEKSLAEANAELFASVKRGEPDLKVDGLDGSIMSRLLALFGVS